MNERYPDVYWQCEPWQNYYPTQNFGPEKKRKRVPTQAQRRAANIRERRRMFNLNEAFDTLRKRVPTFAYEKRLSRIETLRLAITYIAFMTAVIDGQDAENVVLSSAQRKILEKAYVK
ncbi:unnamed protein product [Dimorphilus gyrociliatus]|uniref:BHLH domain-containing protein n=1 Tax=Dimorphilus gyrociliatus TaxID=2664684 RepID=A0A7I8VAN9_9ANNE|nr:unnamed protein product [Dimorphilus gyrociliatus]